MLQRIIRIAVSAAAALALMLEGGCVRTDVPEPAAEGTPIAFGAGSYLLRNDAATKGLTEDFTSNNDTFAVFGEKVTVNDVHTPVFDGVTVNHRYEKDAEGRVVEDEWYYTSTRCWQWTSESDRYDFVAVSPANVGSVKEETVGNLSVSTHYDYNDPNDDNDVYDILAATYRRTGTNWNRRYDMVELTFSHMGSAVCVVVANTSSTRRITVTSIYYENLVVSADAKVSLNSNGQTDLRWTNRTPSADTVRKQTKNPATEIGPQTRYEGGAYQIMIPQDLTLYNAALYLTYIVDDDPEVEEEVITSPPILLSSIQRTDGTPITSWEIGYKYTYDVSIRLDGGLLVTVTTTPWDEPVQGETPGILI